MSNKLKPRPDAARTAGSLHRDCWAAQTAYVERKTREARRKLNELSRCQDKYKPLSGYWEGQYVALVKLKRRFERCVKAQPNSGTHEPRKEKL